MEARSPSHLRVGARRFVGGRAQLVRRVSTERAFTLVELLLVIAVIAIVVSLVLSGLSLIQTRAREAKSMSNMRQWGTGFISYAHDHEGRLPWEGLKEPNQIPVNLAQRSWWANAVPPYVGELSYSDYETDLASGSTNAIPLPANDSSIFIDPAAESPDPQLSDEEFRGWVGGGKRFYFNYAPNAELNNKLDDLITSELDRRTRLSSLGQPGVTVIMLELRSVQRELESAGFSDPAMHPFWNELLNRHMGDWQRFAARHRGGGHMLFGDGHVEWRDNQASSTAANGQFVNDNSLDHNKPDLIWDPLGPTNE
ncbi:MAG: hypothetical protein RL591_335 [Planctomycetota bacterium]